MPFEESEFAPSERARLRKLLMENDRAMWAWRKSKIVVPILVAIIVGTWSVIEWILRHIQFKP